MTSQRASARFIRQRSSSPQNEAAHSQQSRACFIHKLGLQNGSDFAKILLPVRPDSPSRKQPKGFQKPSDVSGQASRTWNQRNAVHAKAGTKAIRPHGF
jgi:hypothetical protein